MQSPRQPNVYVERHRAVAQLTDSGLKQWDGVIPKRGIKGFIKHNSIFPERALGAVLGVES
jgi:hypothetical protein